MAETETRPWVLDPCYIIVRATDRKDLHQAINRRRWMGWRLAGGVFIHQEQNPLQMINRQAEEPHPLWVAMEKIPEEELTAADKRRIKAVKDWVAEGEDGIKGTDG